MLKTKLKEIEKPQHKTRAERGMLLASRGHVRKVEPRTTSAQLYKVQSEKNPKAVYNVLVKQEGPLFCDCPDFQQRGQFGGFLCKHQYAVIYSEVKITA